ncbi:MAG: DUF5412 domain-containing protein [Clostridia bacterium]|nr:DUF5412 domain-containing protein [Clostridia bacterium]
MKKFLKVIIPILIVIAVGAYAINWAFFDIQRIDGQELLHEVVSPDGKYTVSAYLNNGGATTDYAVLCSVKNNDTDKEKNIYWNYHCTEAVIEWNNEDTVTINGIKLNVTTDTYDYRND